MRNTLILLLSGKVNIDLKPILGNISNLRIPIANRLNSQLVIDRQLNHFDNIILTIDQEDLNFANIYKKKYEKVRIVESRKDYSVDLTLLKVFEEIKDNIGKNTMTILFGDCLLDIIPKVDCIINGYTPFLSEWAICSRNDNDDLEISEIECSNRDVVSGAFVLTNASLYIDIFLKLFEIRTKNTKKIIYKSLEEYDRSIKIGLVKSKSWLDLGHKKHYFHTKKSRINTSSRNQSTTQYNANQNTVIKDSDPHKISDEIKWYENLPNEIMEYVPKISNTSSNSYEINYIEGVTLAELWISNSDLLNIPKIYLKQLEIILNTFTKITKERETTEDFYNYRKYLFHDKLLERLDKIKSDLNFIDLNNLKINNKNMMPLNEYLALLNSNLDLLRPPSEYLVLSHGDLFFGNILIDQNNKLRLIDPKGFSFLYSDPLYDICKLSQSIIADYDYISADIFGLTFGRNRVDFDLPNNLDSKYHEEFESFLKSRLDVLKIDYKYLNLLTSSLLMSAIPFHSESNDRQLVMFSKALELVSNY
jgi:thiamine kinase-like enzyme